MLAPSLMSLKMHGHGPQSHGSQPEVSRLLLEAGAQKESATRELGITPLHRAAQEGHLEVVRLLLSAGAAKDKAILSDGATPLLFAAHLAIGSL